MKVAFVVQRCGLEVNGGAEALCLKIAQRMSAHWEIEILTTRALDYVTWENHYPPGVEQIGDLAIRRFDAAPRDNAYFNRLSANIHPRIAETKIEEQKVWMRAQGPWSPELLNYLERHETDYDAFIFFTYLYATSYFGLPLVESKAYLAPLAHDEWPIHLTMWDAFFKRPRGFIFNSIEEKQFLEKRFPDANLAGPITGVAVEPPVTVDGERFRARFDIRDPFLLYVGRIDPSKGCVELLSFFIAAKQHGRFRGKLVLLGRAVMDIPEHPDIVALGYVDEQTKWDAIAACDVLVMPSPYESLSMALLEAWTIGKSVLVNGASPVLVGQCRRAQGGLWYANEDEFVAALEYINEPTSQILGKQGKAFVEQNYNWKAIELKYLDTVRANISAVPAQPEQDRLQFRT